MTTLPGKLRESCLNFPELLAQNIALISPTITAALIVPLMFATTGNISWVAYALGAIMLLFVAFNLNQFARRSSHTGSMFLYSVAGLGPTAGGMAGWCLIPDKADEGPKAAGNMGAFFATVVAFFLVELCPAYDAPAHQGHHHHSQGGADFQDCPFGSAPALGPVSHLIAFEPPGWITFRVALPARRGRLVTQLLRIQQPRGPPSLA